MILVGIDWGEQLHDITLLDERGQVLGHVAIRDGIEGVGRLHALIAEHADDPGRVCVGVEIDRGLLVGSLLAAGYHVYAINPKAVDRYRDRHRISGAKSDGGDSRLLADIVRTDRHLHRRVAGDSDLAEAVKITARAHQRLIWTRQRQVNQLRNALREYYPGALTAFGADLAHHDAVAVLAKAPTPQQGRQLTTGQIVAALRRGGRQRNLDARAATIRHALQAPQLAAAPALTAAYADTTRALVAVIATLSTQIDELERTLTERFEQHPDAEILRSLPGLGVVLGARVLGEFGDDPNRYADAKARKNYAGSSPLTKQSGKHKAVLARYVRNRWLADALDWWAFASLSCSPGARALYDQHRAAGDSHHQALRALSNRWVGILHGCVKHRSVYDEATAWEHRHHDPAAIATQPLAA